MAGPPSGGPAAVAALMRLLRWAVVFASLFVVAGTLGVVVTLIMGTSKLVLPIAILVDALASTRMGYVAASVLGTIALGVVANRVTHAGAASLLEPRTLLLLVLGTIASGVVVAASVGGGAPPPDTSPAPGASSHP